MSPAVRATAGFSEASRLYDFRFVAGSMALQVTAVIVAGTYAFLAVRFWFAVPAAATACGALAFLAAAILIGMRK